jgi:hypothetical protein
MSVYSVKGKGWRYDFVLKGIRHTEAWFKTKKEAKEAEARKREELKNPPVTEMKTAGPTPTDMAFLDLVNGWITSRYTNRLPTIGSMSIWLRSW